ncbi:MAG: hypothetical protein R3B70_48100, partial [Polyangiaceae bacterium]
MPVSADLVTALHQAAVTAGLDRDALLQGIDETSIQRIQRLPARVAQVRQDLLALAEMDGASGDRLVIWLENALRMTAGRPGEPVFREALRALRPGLRGVATERVEPVEAPRFSPADKGLVRLYISAAREDDTTAVALGRHLASLRREVEVATANDAPLGESAEGFLSGWLADGGLVVCLFSADYIAQDACRGEAEWALGAGPRVRMIPVKARACVLPGLFRGLVRCPNKGADLCETSDKDEGLQRIVEEIAQIVGEMKRQVEEGARAAPGELPLGSDK